MLKVCLCCLFFILSVYSSFAQIDEEVVSAREKAFAEKNAKKEAKKQEEEREAAMVKEMLTKHRFVLEADYLSNGYGVRRSVMSNLNFIKLDSARCIVQVGNVSGLGANGVGGVTADGRVSKYDLQVDKRGGYTLKVTMSSSLGYSDIIFFISPSGNTTADLRGNSAGMLTFSGKIINPQESRIFKGSSM